MAQSSGIWPPYEAFYIHSMLFNAQSAVDSIERVSAQLEQADSEHHLDSELLLNDLQNVIIQGAALSRYFWPARKGYEARAEHLRSVFEIEEDNPLKARDLRNALEHFDEKLDDYLSGGIVGNVIPQYVNFLPATQGVPTHFFRAYYLDKGIFEILGNRYEIQPIAEEIYRIYGYLLYFSEHGDRMLKPQSGDATNARDPTT